MPFSFIKDEALRTQVESAHNTIVTDLNDKHTADLDDKVSGLKSKNAELLDEKKQIQAKLKTFEDFDMEGAKEAMDFLQNNKDAQMIKDGKVDELIEKKTSQMRSDHEAVLGELNADLTASKQRGDLYEGLYKTTMIDDGLRKAATDAKVRAEAVPDILLHGRSVFQLAEDGTLESRDSEGKLRKTVDDKVLTPANWIEGLKRTSPHYWPNSEGAGARGSQGVGDEGDMTAALARAASSGNMTEYRRLRSKQQAS
jgi:hypothetical protein